jgi:hypothetical protein
VSSARHGERVRRLGHHAHAAAARILSSYPYLRRFRDRLVPNVIIVNALPSLRAFPLITSRQVAQEITGVVRPHSGQGSTVSALSSLEVMLVLPGLVCSVRR